MFGFELLVCGFINTKLIKLKVVDKSTERMSLIKSKHAGIRKCTKIYKMAKICHVDVVILKFL